MLSVIHRIFLEVRAFDSLALLGNFEYNDRSLRKASLDKVLGKGVGAPDSTEASTALELFFAPPRPPRSISFEVVHCPPCCAAVRPRCLRNVLLMFRSVGWFRRSRSEPATLVVSRQKQEKPV